MPPDEPDGDDASPAPQGPRREPTGSVPTVRIRLDDFLAGDPALPVAYLLVVAGQARGTTLVVDDVPLVLGRSQDADLVVADETVSRRHVELRGDRTSLEVEDLGSSNGTTLNGNPIVGPITIIDGDLLGLGSATLLVKRVA